MKKDVECENGRGVKEDTKGFGLSNWVKVVPFTEVGSSGEKQD